MTEIQKGFGQIQLDIMNLGIAVQQYTDHIGVGCNKELKEAMTLKEIHQALCELTKLKTADYTPIVERDRLSDRIPWFQVTWDQEELSYVLTPHVMSHKEAHMRQSLLRASWLDPKYAPEVRGVAHADLRAFIAKATVEQPPLTGTFSCTADDVDEAKKHGY